MLPTKPVEALAGTKLYNNIKQSNQYYYIDLTDENSDFPDDESMDDSLPISICLLRNYDYMAGQLMPYAGRCYENAQCFYLVFKPFDSNYDFHFDGMDHIRKYLQKCDPKLIIVTREILAKKKHYNVFIWIKELVLANPNFTLHNKHTSRYMIHQSHLSDLGDRTRVMRYMIKESKERRFNKFVDYKVFTNRF